MKKIITIIFLHAFLISCYGQIDAMEADEIEEEYVHQNHRFRIGITPSSFFNAYPGIQLNGAVNFLGNFQLNTEAGYILYSLTSTDTSITGYRFRPALRFYFSEVSEYRIHFSLAYNIRKTTSTRIDEFEILGTQRTEIAEYQNDIKMNGFAPMIGIDIRISKNFILDMGLGLGISKLEVADRNIPTNGLRIFEDFGNYDTPGIHNFLLTIANIKIQYLL